MYDLGANGDSMTKVAQKSRIMEEVILQEPRGCKVTYNFKFIDFLKPFKIISIAPILSSESQNVHLVAMTSTGLRLYFTTISSQHEHRYSSLDGRYFVLFILCDLYQT